MNGNLLTATDEELLECIREHEKEFEERWKRHYLRYTSKPRINIFEYAEDGRKIRREAEKFATEGDNI